MKKFDTAKMVLFDSSAAYFKVSVEAGFVKKDATGTKNLISKYTNNKGEIVGNINPAMYLVFTYKGETFEQTKSLYMSYPNIYKLRSKMTMVNDIIHNQDNFMQDMTTGALVCKTNEPIVITDIGMFKKSLAFTPCVIEGTTPGVSIKMSDSEYSSALTIDEFETVFTIVNDLDLTSLQAIFGVCNLDDNTATQQPAGYVQYNQPVYRQPQPQQQYTRMQPAYQKPVYQQPAQSAPVYQQQRPQRLESPAVEPERRVTSTVSNAAPAYKKNNEGILSFDKIEKGAESINYDFNDDEAMKSIIDDE